MNASSLHVHSFSFARGQAQPRGLSQCLKYFEFIIAFPISNSPFLFHEGPLTLTSSGWIAFLCRRDFLQAPLYAFYTWWCHFSSALSDTLGAFTVMHFAFWRSPLIPFMLSFNQVMLFDCGSAVTILKCPLIMSPKSTPTQLSVLLLTAAFIVPLSEIGYRSIKLWEIPSLGHFVLSCWRSVVQAEQPCFQAIYCCFITLNSAILASWWRLSSLRFTFPACFSLFQRIVHSLSSPLFLV